MPLMHRLTARFLLILLLVGSFAPVGLAVSTPPPHACCMRKMHSHTSPETEFRALDCGSHDCCRPLTVSHAAQLRPRPSAYAAPASVAMLPQLRPIDVTAEVNAAHSVRAPPFSIA
ncbi:MAG: hypothetical protein LAN83_04815 [Acidobacteriia bacterium]|nr:hypothetical protein [Terriglobia bacterium]